MFQGFWGTCTRQVGCDFNHLLSFLIVLLFDPSLQAEAERYNGGALAIFRLAPQDYHRFHSPVDGKIGKMTYISGEYYTVNVRQFICVLCLLSPHYSIF